MRGWVMTREGFRHAGIIALAVMAAVSAAWAGPGGGPGGGGPGGALPGGGSGFSGPASHGSAYPPDHDDYDYSGPSFNFSVRKARRPVEQKDGVETPEKQAPASNPGQGDLWDRFKSRLGLGE